MKTHDDWLTWGGTTRGKAEGHLGWAAYYRAAGDVRRAQCEAALALEAATDPRQPLALIAVQRFLGELEADAGRFTEATAHLDAALALADACAAPHERAQTQYARAVLLAATDKATEAQDLLDEVVTIARGLGAAPLLARVEALAARVPHLLAASAAGLTARQIEVLRCAVAGMTDAQIADTLSISRRTVSEHLGMIYRKLAVTSRTAATRYAIEHGIV